MLYRTLITSLKNRAIFDLLLLYISKSGGVVVGIFILPWYQRLLGASDFGVVALILALQAFFLMMDLGTSTLVGREISAEKSFTSHRSILKVSELVLHLFYTLLIILALIFVFLFDSNFSSITIVLSIVLFWALSIQNVGQSALMAYKKYHLAAISQILGILFRAIFTLLILTYVAADISHFIMAQASVAILQMLLTMYFCTNEIDSDEFEYKFRKIIPIAKDILRRGAPLVAFGLAGAAVMQMDKVIIGAWGNTEAVASYYLASTLCLVPISVLAGPVAQYFQPKIIKNLTSQDFKNSERNLKFMLIILLLMVGGPSLFLWLNRDIVVNLWLRGQNNEDEVINYVKLLLPGVAIGATGFVSYVILIAYQDYKVQAIISASMTVVTLIATAFFIRKNNIEAICIVYVIYHIFSAFVGWLRASYLQRKNNYHSFLYKSGWLFFLIVIIFMTIGISFNLL